MPDTLKLALVTDVHHGPDTGSKRGSRALDLLADFVGFAEASGADAVVDLGDRISDVDATTDRRLMAEVAAVLRRCRLPRHHLLGNHDCAFLGAAENEAALGAPQTHHAVDLKGWHLVFWQAHTHIAFPDTFSIRRSDLDWLAADLDATDLPAIVFSHVPLDSGSMRGNHYFERNPAFAGYPNAAEARAVIRSAGIVRACIAGHVHWNALNVLDGIPYVSLQSLTESFTTGGEPAAAWTLLELGKRIRVDVHGRDPLHLTLPAAAPRPGWLAPRPPYRAARRPSAPPGLDGIRGLIFDLDGVLYRGEEAIPGAADFVAWAQGRGYRTMALTNNARRDAAACAAKLAGLGIAFPAADILTAGRATALALAEADPGARVFVAGPPALRRELLRTGCVESDRPDYVVAGIDLDMTLGRLAEATRHLRRGARLVMTNPDRVLPTPDGPAPESGAVMAFLEAAGGVAATVIGKPNPRIFERARLHLDLPADAILMIGDTPETDIRGAIGAGLRAALVGAAGLPDDPAARPTVAVADLAALRRLLAG